MPLSGEYLAMLYFATFSEMTELYFSRRRKIFHWLVKVAKCRATHAEELRRMPMSG